MNHDVSELMFFPFSGDESDEFGKDKGARLPLLLPKVMEGRPTQSTSRLFSQLPPEILAGIMDLIADDKAALAALALVNSDCRQLARSCQFADVCFDYSPNSARLLLQLTKEAVARLGYDGSSNSREFPFIGPCIRRVAVKPRADWVAYAHSDLYNAIQGASVNPLSPQHRNELSKKAADEYFATYRAPILCALELAMPHLEALLWYDPLCLDGAFFRTITKLPIRHLRLARAHVGETLRLEPPLTPLVVPLESLSLRIGLCTNEMFHADAGADSGSWNDRSLSPFIQTLLRRCSTTLRRLSLRCEPLAGNISLSFGPEDVFLPRLRYLDLSGDMSEPDKRGRSSLLSGPLRHLSLPFVYSPAFEQAVSACPTLRDLETLVIEYLDGKHREGHSR